MYALEESRYVFCHLQRHISQSLHTTVHVRRVFLFTIPASAVSRVSHNENTNGSLCSDTCKPTRFALFISRLTFLIKPDDLSSEELSRKQQKPLTMTNKGKHVRFTPNVEVNIIDALDPKLKADLFYSREEMQLIQKRFKVEYTLKAICLRSKQLEARIKQNQTYADHLKNKQHGTITTRKRPLLQEAGEPPRGEAQTLSKRPRVTLQPVA